MAMKLIRLMGMVAPLLFAPVAGCAGASSTSAQVGDTYEITRTKDSVRHGNNLSSGSSHDQDKIIERVVAVRADGVEWQYDLPDAATATARADLPAI